MGGLLWTWLSNQVPMLSPFFFLSRGVGLGSSELFMSIAITFFAPIAAMEFSGWFTTGLRRLMEMHEDLMAWSKKALRI